MNPQNQTVLALIAALVLSTAFVGAYALEYQYNQSTPMTEVWVSDSNMEFSQVDTSLTMPELDGLVMGLASYKFWGFPTYTSYEATNSTGVYTGNNTWAASMIGFSSTTPIYTVGSYYIPVDIPEASTFLANYIALNVTLPPEDVLVQIYLSGYTDPATTIIDAVGVSLYSNTIDGAVTTNFEQNFHLSTYQTLTWYNMCQKEGVTPALAVYMYDTPKDGMNSYALQMNISIKGTAVTSWSLQDSVNVAVGGAIVFNIVLGIYMTDAIDWNNIKRKDLKKGR